MAIRKEERGDRLVVIIDISWRDKQGRQQRHRRDAQVQTMTAARAEERRLLTHLGEHGEMPQALLPIASSPSKTFDDAAKGYKEGALLAKKPSTQKGYKEILNGPLLATLRATKLAEIDVTILRAIDTTLLKRKVGPSRRRNVQAAIRSVLRDAVSAKLLATMPDVPALPKVGRAIVDPFPVASLPAMLAAANDGERVPLALCAYAGLRAGEARGIEWGDVDLETNQLVVRRAYSGTSNEASPPKSGSQRIVPLATPLRALIAALPRRGRAEPLAVNPNGARWRYEALLKAFHRATKKIGLGQYGLHSLRHCFVTALFGGGVSAPDVQALVGHASLVVTQLYAHRSTNDLRRAIATLG